LKARGAVKAEIFNNDHGRGNNMTKIRKISMPASVLAISLLFSTANTAFADEQEWWDMARKASCPELVQAYKTTATAERKVAREMKSASASTTGTNLLGVATLAIVGFGFFTWNDSASAEENLADLRNDLHIIKTVAAEKACALPAIPA
jgi:hypothetical protein